MGLSLNPAGRLDRCPAWAMQRRRRPSDELAVLFPGQGVGDPSARRELVRAAAPRPARARDGAAGEDPFARIGDGTRFAQPAIYCASLAGLDGLGRPAARPVAGHSLGEVAALAAAGAVDEPTGCGSSPSAARLMEEAAEAAGPAACSPSAAIAEQARELARAHGLALANENSPEPVRPHRRRAALELDAPSGRRASRGLRAKRLAVAGAFHSPAMEPAVAPFRRAPRRRSTFRPPRVAGDLSVTSPADRSRPTRARCSPPR